MNITLHLTNRCNLKCTYCYVDKHHLEEMTWDTAKQAIDRVVKCSQGRIGISFFGGEPLLKKELIQEVITYCEKLEKHTAIKFSYNLTTNGILLDEAFLRYASEKRISLAISHDGIKACHDACRVDENQKGSFERVNQKTELLLKYHPYAAAIMVLNPSTVVYFYEGMVHLFDKGFKYILSSFNYGAEWDKKSLKLLEAQYKLLSKLYYEKSMANEKFYMAVFDNKIGAYIDNQKFKDSKCILGKSHISIAPDGSIYPCTQFVGDNAFLMGHAQTGVIRDVSYLHDEEPYEEACLICSIKDRCSHYCSCLNKQGTGDINKISPVLCAHERMVTIVADTLAKKLYKAKNEIFINKHYNALYPFASVIEDKLGETNTLVSAEYIDTV